jgi:hypothetical protein
MGSFDKKNYCPFKKLGSNYGLLNVQYLSLVWMDLSSGRGQRINTRKVIYVPEKKYIGHKYMNMYRQDRLKGVFQSH